MKKTDWTKIKNGWIYGNKTYKQLSEEFGVSVNAISRRKRKENWVQRKNWGGKKGNKYAVGNRGNPNARPPKRNTNAKKHGFYVKHIPKETLEIMDSLFERSPADIVWEQIKIQYAAIVRAQQLMFVKEQNEVIKEVKKSEESQFGEKVEYEIQFSWDRQANFLNAQSRAMSELRSAIRHFMEITDEHDERRLKLQAIQATIDKTKAETERLKKDNTTAAPPNIIIVDEWADNNDD